MPAGVVVVGVDPEHQLGQGLGVDAEGFGDLAEQFQGGAGEQHEEHQGDGAGDVQVGQDLHAFVQAGCHGDGGGDGDAADDGDLHRGNQGHVPEDVHAGGNLQYAQADGDGEAEDGADDAQGVEKFAGRFVHAAAEQWREHGGHSRGHFALIDEVPHRQTRQGENDPHVDAEVVVGELERLDDRVAAHGFVAAAWRVEGVVQRFGSTPEQQRCAHAGGKEHAEPDGV